MSDVSGHARARGLLSPPVRVTCLTDRCVPPRLQDHMKHLNQLRRQPENKCCATCTHEDRMGFKDVCMKFKIFICSDCKSAHQSFSHRCKVLAIALAG